MCCVNPGDVYVVCHTSVDDIILPECDQFSSFLSNGDDLMALTQVSSGIVLDVVGIVGEDPGEGWDVAGIEEATKDHTLVRKFSVNSGNLTILDNPETGRQVRLERIPRIQNGLFLVKICGNI